MKNIFQRKRERKGGEIFLYLPSISMIGSSQSISSPEEEEPVIPKALREDPLVSEYLAFTRYSHLSPNFSQFTLTPHLHKDQLLKAEVAFSSSAYPIQNYKYVEGLALQIQLIIRKAIKCSESPDLEAITEKAQQMVLLAEGSLFPYLQASFLSMAFYNLSGQNEKSCRQISNLVCFLAKYKLLQNMLLCYNFYFRLARTMNAQEDMMNIVKKRLKLSWSIGSKDSEIQCYGDLSLVYFYLGDLDSTLLFKQIYDAGQTLPGSAFKALSLEHLRTELLFLREGIFILQDELSTDLLLNEFRAMSRPGKAEVRVNSQDYLKQMRKECKVEDELKYLVMGPVRIVRGKKEYKIRGRSDLKFVKSISNQQLTSNVSRSNSKQLLTHLSRNKNFQQYYAEKKGSFYDVYRPHSSWKVILLMLGLLLRETRLCKLSSLLDS